VDESTSVAARVKQAIDDYLLWLISNGYASSTCNRYERILNRFHEFVLGNSLSWNAVFTADTLARFESHCGHTLVITAVTGLSRYLFQHKRIPQPIDRAITPLPQIYEEYLAQYAELRQVHRLHLLRARKLLGTLHEHLNSKNIPLRSLTIEQIDMFLADYNRSYARVSQQNNRSYVRGFLRYLFEQRRTITKDLAALVVGAPVFAHCTPPKFLRPHEVQTLFSSQSLSTPGDLRRYALLHIAFHVGLRPKEISLIRLDDISFAKAEITLPERKSANPIVLPLPEGTIKALAAYIVGARPRSDHRAVFLLHRAPYTPLRPATVSVEIKRCFLRANLSASAYWLRHTYAQNLLEAGTSIFEIKEMMGHDSLQSSRRYLHIHPTLMRKVLFDETL